MQPVPEGLTMMKQSESFTIGFLVSLVEVEGVHVVSMSEIGNPRSVQELLQTRSVSEAYLYCKRFVDKLDVKLWRVENTIYRPSHMKWVVSAAPELNELIQRVLT